MTQFPDGITLERNRDLGGRAWSPWVRRLLLCCIAVLPFRVARGVRTAAEHSSAASPAASLSVTAPTRLRGGGLIFQAKVKVVAHRQIAHLQIGFDTGWWESMSVNSIDQP